MRKALICGYPRSGNSLLYRIIMSLQGAEYQSFMETTGLTSLARAQCGPFMSFPEIARLDNLRLPGGIPHLEFPHPECRTVRVSGTLLDQVSTLIWTHELPDAIRQSPFTGRQNFYVIRDGRDVISSMVHYSVTRSSRRLQPHYKSATATEVYSNIELFKKWTIEWSNHVNSYLMNQDFFCAVRYEDLVENKEKQVRQIIEASFAAGSDDFNAYLARIGPTLEATDRDRFRAIAPDHIHQGRPGTWQEEWSAEQTDVFFEYAGEVMVKLGYE